MRILNGLLFLFMILFAAVQYNDPDGLFWAAVYAIPGGWAGSAAFRPGLLAFTAARALWTVLMLSYLAVTFYFWPTDPDWWRMDVWWENEPAREGMGVMIATVVLAIAGLSDLLRTRPTQNRPV